MYSEVMRLGFPGGLVLFVWLVGCGSDPAPKPAPRPETDDLRQDVLDKCEAFGERLCARASACCSSHGSFEEAECVGNWLADVCSPAASVVAEGLATYDDSAEEDCLEAQGQAFDTCVGDWDATLAHREAIWSACKVVRGTREPGETCDTSALCAPPEGAAKVECIRSVCTVRELFLVEGEECPYPNGDVSTCAPGLYCTAMSQGELGDCVAATPLEESCDPVLLNPECGMGNYCDLESAVCRKATNFGGPTCDSGTECVSFNCNRNTRTCVEPPPLLDCRVDDM